MFNDMANSGKWGGCENKFKNVPYLLLAKSVITKDYY